jgi:hypothetical protein
MSEVLQAVEWRKQQGVANSLILVFWRAMQYRGH